MTRKDFELIAATLRSRVEAQRIGSANDAVRMAELRILASDFARELSATNPRFDAGRFLEACGL